MKNLRPYLIVFIILISITVGESQLLLTEFKTQKIDGNNILLRWEPRSSEDWIASKTIGYTIGKYRTSADGNEEFLGSELIKPAPLDDWLKYEGSNTEMLNDFAVGARSFIYPESGDKENQFDKIFDLNGDKKKNAKLSLGFLLYASSYDFEIAKLSGLAFEMPSEKGYSYRFEIQTGTSEPILIHINPETYQEPKVSEMTPEWGDKKVEISWDGSYKQGDFLGYMVSKSEDGLLYEKMNKTPRTNSLGLLPDTSALLQMSYTDSLDENDKTYWYKFEGFDYFGSVSKTNQIVFGQGYDAIGISPIIEFANQTEDNHAHLKWYMPEKLDKLVSRYRITRSDNDKGPYKIVIDSISNTLKEYKVPITSIENHFRVEAVPYRGKPVGSISVFIMGQDTVPPAIPELISAFIDSVGVIEVKWKANTEEDLWGYRIFKSNFNQQEYGLVNNVITQDTIFRDTVDINFNTENVFYKIYATDRRDNKSEFTLPIKVEKPDIFPPAMAGLGKIEQRNDSLIINWFPSSSDDVVNHNIFRRAINLENSWTLVGILDSNMVGQAFIDTGLEYNVPYAYTIIAYDEVGLESNPIQPKNFTLKKRKEKFDPITNVDHIYNEELKEITLTWDFKEKSRIEHILIYRGSDKSKMGKYKILAGDALNLVDMATDESKLYYKVKPIYYSQTEDYFSETIEVEITKSE